MSSLDQVPPAPSVFTATAGDIVILKIGPGTCDYRVHHALLTHHSEYFRKALCGDWKEAREGVVPLLDVELQIFKFFVEWLYTGGEEDWMKSYNALGLVLLKAYVFGDRFIAPVFRSAIMDNIISHVLVPDKNDGLPDASMELINYAYTNIASKNAVVQLLVDGFCKHWSFEKGSIKTVHKELPSAFLHRILGRFGEEQSKALIDCRKRAAVAQRKMDEYRNYEKAPFTEAQTQYRAASNKEKRLKKELHNRCYREHGTDQDKKHCAEACVHTRYDKDADYGFFE
ncbi:hypothetical protein HRS9122_04745 [Pyrenophora teres f. teres]|nr:hypothetical protein HRS9122_04745 [Pyrenophora teres f. teres]